MRRSLTQSSKTVNGRYCNAYEYKGAEYDVCDSAYNTMLVGELFADMSLTEAEKEALLPRMLFADLDAALAASGTDGFWLMVKEIIWQAMGVDLDNSRGQADAPVFDWDEDAGRIRASMLQAYGLNWSEACRTMSYSEFCDLLTGLMEAGETSMQQAIYYRTAETPHETKHNGDFVKAFRAKREHYRLKGSNPRVSAEDTMKSRNDAMASAFASEFASAKRAGQVCNG